jgi:hypothetical protein
MELSFSGTLQWTGRIPRTTDLLVGNASGGNRSTQENLRSGWLARGGQTGSFSAFDLGHTAIVDDELHDPVTKPFDFFAHERNPVRIREGTIGREIGFRREHRKND